MVHLGTSGYSFSDWKGTVYPEKINPSEMLRYYYSVWNFNSVELNFTYYRQPGYKSIVGITRKIPGKFTFSVKAPGKVTHELWRNKNITDAYKTLDDFFEPLEILKKENRMGMILFQFPYSFHLIESNMKYLKDISSYCTEKNNKIAAEFRNAEWAENSVLKELSYNITPVTVDEPKIGKLFPYIPVKSKNVAYFRFHGRNPNWFNAEGSERYNYNYSEKDLRRFANDVVEFLKDGTEVFVYFNNCHMGQAVNNALRFREILEGEP
ncbi:MAG: DUF72 domain-containing protein [Thermotogota bacterium]|nr:DUF72 domain-containing protein [Thermotogota bacterium]